MLPVVSFEEMLEMSASGAKVLQLRAVEYARNHGVRIHCRSSFDDGTGTLVVSEDETMERPLVTAVAHSTEEARVTLAGVRDKPGVAGEIFGALAEANVNVDVIIQNEPVSTDHGADLSFTVARDDLRRAVEVIAALDAGEQVLTDERIGKVSIVGAGMRSHPGVAAKVFQVLGEAGINIEMISTSPIKISCVIAADRVPDAVRIAPRGVRPRRRRGQGRGRNRRRAPADDYAMSPPRLAVVGATGAVGSTILEVLAEREFAVERARPLRLGALRRQLGGARRLRARLPRALRGRDRRIRPGDLLGRQRGQRRVGPEVRRARRGGRRQHELLADVRATCRWSSPRSTPTRSTRHRGIIANPNCSTMQMVVALEPIWREAGIERLVISTYQSVSGTGSRAVEELRAQTAGELDGSSPAPAVYPHPIAFNVIPQVETFKRRRRLHDRGAQDDGRDAQDPRRLERRARHLRDLRARSCLRCPFGVGQRPDARRALGRRNAASCWRPRPGWSSSTTQPPATTRCPSPPPATTRSSSAGSAATPRIERCLNLWIVGDNLRKGAATNAVQIAELLCERELVGAV